MESEARLAAVRTENESESLHEARLAADVERVIVSRENKNGSRSAADAVKIVVVARENKSESLREARLAANVERVIVARENER